MENKLSVDYLDKLINIIGIHTVSVYSEGDFGLNTYVDGLKLYFEACMWSEMYPVEQTLAGTQYGSQYHIKFKGVKSGHEVPFTDYLILRLYNYLGSLFKEEASIKSRKFKPLNKSIKELNKDENAEERKNVVLILANLLILLRTKIGKTAKEVLKDKEPEYKPPELILLSDSK